MITLYAFGPAFGLPDPSPFVMKTHMLLKLADLPYRIDTTGFRKAPKGKLPYIDDAGTTVSDSTFIRRHIEQRHGFDFDGGLTAEQRGVVWAVEKMLEDHVYWAVLDARWCNDENFAKGPALFFAGIPWPMRPIIQRMVRRKISKGLISHGLGRHTQQEIITLVDKAMESLSAILGDKPYLMGTQPCGADATALAFVSGLLCQHFITPLRTVTEKYPNLVAYSNRMMPQYFPESATGR